MGKAGGLEVPDRMPQPIGGDGNARVGASEAGTPSCWSWTGQVSTVPSSLQPTDPARGGGNRAIRHYQPPGAAAPQQGGAADQGLASPPGAATCPPGSAGQPQVPLVAEGFQPQLFPHAMGWPPPYWFTLGNVKPSPIRALFNRRQRS